MTRRETRGKWEAWGEGIVWRVWWLGMRYWGDGHGMGVERLASGMLLTLNLEGDGLGEGGISL